MEQPNMTYINELSGGDKEFESKIITIIKQEFPEEKQNYYSSIEKEDFNTAAAHVHKLKHKISILGLKASYNVASDYENNLKRNTTNGKAAFDEVLHTITNFLNTI